MVGTAGGEGVERGSWSTAGEGVSGIANPAARGQLKRNKTRHDLGGAIQDLRRWSGSHESWLDAS